MKRVGVGIGVVAIGAAAALVLAGCAPSAEPQLAGRLYTSASGRGTAGNLAWLGSKPLVMKFEMMNNEQTMVLDTPCNTLNAPVQITDHQIALIEPQRISATAMGCLGPEGEYETWATEFIKTPMTYTDVDGILTLTSTAGAITFSAV